MRSPAQQPDPNDAIRDEATHLCAKVKALPDHIFKPPSRYPVVVQFALVESFHVAVRALMEFLLIHETKNSNDVRASSVLSSWTPQLTPAKRRELNKHWKTVSEQLVHFSAARSQPVNAVEAEVRQLAAEVLAVWDQFAAASGHPLIPKAADNHIFDEPTTGART